MVLTPRNCASLRLPLSRARLVLGEGGRQQVKSYELIPEMRLGGPSKIRDQTLSIWLEQPLGHIHWREEAELRLLQCANNQSTV